MADTVKTRAYDASSRRAHARERRTRVLDVAWEQFRRRGYASTTVAAVAHAAGVSEQTIYKTYGGKSGLVRHLRIRALEGDEHFEPAERRSDRLRSDLDPRRIVAGWARLASEVAPRVSPVLLLVRDAALTDPGLQGLMVEMDSERRRRMRENAESLARAGILKAGVSTEHATDVLFAVSSPEMFELLVIRCGWDLPRYAAYVEGTICAALLPA